MPRYKLVIFDFDGTLADSGPWMRSVFNEVADRFGFKPCTPEELQALSGLDNREVMTRLGVPAWKLPFIVAHVRRRLAKETDKIPLFPRTADLLRALHAQKLALCIVSSNSEANVRRILGPQLAALIGHYGCGASIFGKRPKFRKALQRTGVPANETLAVGDEVRDIVAASAEGIDSGAVTWGYAQPELLRSRAPTVVFESFEELLHSLCPPR